MSGEASDRAPSVDGSTATAVPVGDLEIDVGEGEPPVRCPYCDRPFRRERYERLHRGREHLERLSDRERASVERTTRDEYAELRRFRLYALGVLVVLYFGLLIVAAFVV